jgi:hypothetical protein
MPILTLCSHLIVLMAGHVQLDKVFLFGRPRFQGLLNCLQVGLSNGMQATVTKIDPEKGITLDCNHELAGKPKVGGHACTGHLRNLGNACMK